MSESDTSADEMRSRIIRERKTEQRIRQMDVHEIVSEIHELEDENARLVAKCNELFRYWRRSIQEYYR